MHMSSHWNYRILARKIKDEIQYGFYEVHYEGDVPVAYTENLIYPVGFNSDDEPVDSIIWQLDNMKIACNKPILDYDNFPNEYVKYSRKKKLKLIEEYFKKNWNISKK